VTVILAIVGWFDLACTIGLAGGYISAALIAPPSPAGRRATQWATGLLVVTLLVEAGIFGVRMAAVSSTDSFVFLREMLETKWARLWIARCAGLALLFTLPLGAPPFGARRRALLAAFWLLLRSLQGHAGAHGTLPTVIDWVHLLAAASWLGSLVQLPMSRGAALPMSAERVRRLATVSVAALVPAGVYGALLHIPSFERLVNTPYGRALLVKLGLAAVLLVLGAANHLRYVPALLQQRHSAAEQQLRRVVRWEIIIAALVILMSALLGVLPMPHAAPQ
jgi:copper transport protein